MTLKESTKQILLTVSVMVGALASSYGVYLLLGSTIAVLLLLQLAVVVIAFQANAKFAYIAAVVEAVCFNFLFTMPQYSLVMWRLDDMTNVVVFVLVAVITSQLADRYKRQQDALKQAELRNRILLSVSHDLRTPLATIIGTLSTLKEYSPLLSRTETTELIDSATQESHRLHQYIENLLQATKLQHGALIIKKAEESIVQVINQVVARLGERQSRVVVQVEPHLPTVMVSASLIAQALYNVVDNALRYSPISSQVSIHAYQKGEHIWVDVKDEGVGVSSEQAQQIFELFYSDAGLKHNDSGSGLGLAVAKGLITAHDGQIEAMPDKTGSLFRIQLPLGVN